MVNSIVEVLNSNVHGRGVFAAQNISKGTILNCDVILIKKDLAV